MGGQNFRFPIDFAGYGYNSTAQPVRVKISVFPLTLLVMVTTVLHSLWFT